MTPAARYVASLYETAVDANMHLDAIRCHLAAHGVPRTPAQVAHDLDTVYAFTGYADSHPAPSPSDTAALDRAIDSMTPKELRQYDAACCSPVRKRPIANMVRDMSFTLLLN